MQRSMATTDETEKNGLLRMRRRKRFGVRKNQQTLPWKVHCLRERDNRMRKRQRRVAPLYVSPTTGKTANDYVMDAFYASNKSAAEFCRRCGFKNTGLTELSKRTLQPRIRTIIQVERFTGRKIADYLPEVAQGIELIRSADEWREAFQRKRMRRFGVYISSYAMRKIFLGEDIADMTIKLETVARMRDFHEWWTANGETLKERHRGGLEYMPNVYDIQYAEVDSEEEEKALKAYHWAMSSWNAKMYDMHRLRMGLWEFGTENFRCELDLVLNELRTYWRKTGALSSTRMFDQDIFKDSVMIVRRDKA